MYNIQGKNRKEVLNMKKVVIIIILLVSLITLAGCDSSIDKEIKKVTLNIVTNVAGDDKDDEALLCRKYEMGKMISDNIKSEVDSVCYNGDFTNEPYSELRDEIGYGIYNFKIEEIKNSTMSFGETFDIKTVYVVGTLMDTEVNEYISKERVEYTFSYSKGETEKYWKLEYIYITE